MTMVPGTAVLVAVLLLAAAAALVVAPGREVRARRVVPGASPGASSGMRVVPPGWQRLVRRHAGVGLGPAARRRRAAQRMRAVRALATLAAELESGQPPREALRRSSGDPPVWPTASAAVRLDGDVATALEADAARAPVLAQLAACWRVAADSGAGLAPAVTRLAESARSAEDARVDLEGQLAGPRATARLLALLPVVGIGFGFLLGSDPLAWLLGSAVGRACLAAGVLLTVTGLGAWLVVRPAVDGRLAAGGRPPDVASADRAGTPAAGLSAWTVRGASALGALSAWWLLGGVIGAVAAAAILLLGPRVLGRMESRAARARRTALDRQAPLLADLLAATLATGATLGSSLGAVATAVGEPTAGLLRPALAAMELGADPVEAWRACAGPGAHALVIDAVARSAESGAPVSRVLSRLADDLRREHRVVVEVAARSAGVRAVAPLAACFLPAFVLLGVVPVVASLAGTVLS